MAKNFLIVWAGIIAGVFLGYFLVTKTNILNIGEKNSSVADVFKSPKKVVIGFLPFWLINRAKADYSPYITQLSYFNLTIDSDGKIQKYTSPGEADPGWHALYTGKVDEYLASAKSKGIELSLTVFSGNDEKINKFLENPKLSAQNLMDDLNPVISQYGFSDLNLDIEKVAIATPDQRIRYTNFVSEVRKRLDPNVTITIDLPCIAFVKDENLGDPKALVDIADYLVMMGYDFHNQGSSVTGPVSPQYGAGIVSEFDIVSAVQGALTVVPARKLILAIPLYGYSWETINSFPRAATLPGSAFSISSKTVEDLFAECSTCSANFDKTDAENYSIYKDTETGTFHQVFFPDKSSTQVKVDFVKSQNMGGMALWALGYEGSTILQPLSEYLH